ncbi:MAG: hypothetical protein NZ898_09580, partial [Myxococcota bacterium]|nr:hypothetical protein [Myxococcota bacterium]
RMPMRINRACTGAESRILIVPFIDTAPPCAVASLVVDADGRGHDDANHDWDGMFVMAGPALRSRGPIEGLRLFDVGPTCLAHAGLRPPEDWLGRVVP